MTKKEFLLFVALILVASAGMCSTGMAFRLKLQDVDTVTAQQMRFEAAKDGLMPQAKNLDRARRIFYLSDPRKKDEVLPDRVFNPLHLKYREALHRYVLAQYAMAPAILVPCDEKAGAVDSGNSDPGKLVLGDFELPLPDLKQQGLEVQERLPYGVCFLKRIKR